MPEGAPRAAACEPAAELTAGGPGGAWTLRAVCDDGAREGAEPRGPARLLLGGRLDPNRAGAPALQVIPGVGPKRAEALLRARRERPFCELRELERARGVGPVTRERAAAFLAIEPRPASCPSSR